MVFRGRVWGVMFFFWGLWGWIGLCLGMRYESGKVFQRGKMKYDVLVFFCLVGVLRRGGVVH